MSRKMKTMDGNNAAAWVSYPFTDVAAIYPITPYSVMAEVTDQWSAKGQTNIRTLHDKIFNLFLHSVFQVLNFGIRILLNLRYFLI